MIRASASLVLLTLSACAVESAQTRNAPNDITANLSEEQARVVANARQQQVAKGYSEQERAAIDLAIDKVNEETPASWDTVTDIRIRAIQWPDSSLGCAEPGVQYLQKVVPGYLVSFRLNEAIHTVNVGENRAIICDRVNAFMLERKRRADAVLGAHKAATLDLAERLNVNPSLVKVDKIKIETWPDSSLGCPVSGQSYKEGPTDGLRINMTCRDKQYEYRIPLEGGDFVICEEIVSCHETE